MPQSWQKPLICAHEAEIRELLDEIRAADDIDLWEEAAAKLTDVVIVYRRAIREQAAFNLAFAQAFSEDVS